jgi:transposase
MSARRVRTREPQRAQGVIRFEIPEETLPADHPARMLWRIVETLDLWAFLAKGVEGRQGRDRTSVRMLLTLWLYAISVGVGSAREIERRQSTDPAFQWIVGDEHVGRSTLSEFRISHREALDKLFTDVLAALLHRGLASLDLVAQDGTRVRASASAPSFRREGSLAECRLCRTRAHIGSAKNLVWGDVMNAIAGRCCGIAPFTRAHAQRERRSSFRASVPTQAKEPTREPWKGEAITRWSEQSKRIMCSCQSCCVERGRCRPPRLTLNGRARRRPPTAGCTEPD